MYRSRMDIAWLRDQHEKILIQMCIIYAFQKDNLKMKDSNKEKRSRLNQFQKLPSKSILMDLSNLIPKNKNSKAISRTIIYFQQHKVHKQHRISQMIKSIFNKSNIKQGNSPIKIKKMNKFKNRFNLNNSHKWSTYKSVKVLINSNNIHQHFNHHHQIIWNNKAFKKISLLQNKKNSFYQNMKNSLP